MPKDNSGEAIGKGVGRRAVLAGAVVGAALTGINGANAQTSPQPDVSKPMPEGLPAANRGAQLAGKIAVVTGAARGIGRAIAWEMAANGADVIVLDICAPVSSASNAVPATQADLTATADGVRTLGRKCNAITADIRDIKALRDVASKVEGDFGKIDIVVANAAIQRWKPLLEMDDADWHDVIDNNLNGTANTIRAFAPSMVKRNKGRIIVLSSMQGKHGTKDGSSYSASKWGILGLMKSAAIELGSHKITVNALIPGLVDTALTRYETRFHESMGETMPNPPANPTPQQAWDQRLVQVPLKVGWLQPADLGPAAVFLASDGAAMVTGAEYEVTAGDSAHDI
jgi:NAD(P)-dependent dehydrogenase (short-subunit alcohol dehydrogenase family)